MEEDISLFGNFLKAIDESYITDYGYKFDNERLINDFKKFVMENYGG